MRKNHLLREELSRMRQLMGMNGSLYQKPIMEDKGSKDPGHDKSFGKGSKQPDPQNYKGGAKSKQYVADYAHWQEHNPTKKPSPPASKPKAAPKAKAMPSKAQPKIGTGAKSALPSGEFVLPMGSIPGMGAKGRAPSKGRSARRGKTSRTKTTRGRKTTRTKTTRGKTSRAKTSSSKKSNKRTKKKED